MPRVADLVSRIQKYGNLPANNWKITFGKVSTDEASKGMYVTSNVVMPEGDTRQTYYNRMSLSCDSINVPGRSIASIVDGAIGVGAEQPYTRLYEGDLTVVMIIGREAYERKIFEDWMDQISHPRSGRLSYYKDYTCDAELTLYDKQDIPRYKVIFEEVYPKMVSPIQLSNETPDVIRQQLDFAYRLYRPVDLNATSATSDGVPDEFSTELAGLHTEHPLFGLINKGYDAASDGLSALGSALGWFGNQETTESYAVNGRVLDLTIPNPQTLNESSPFFQSRGWSSF